MTPKISVITPSYNQAEYIESTIQSIITQGYPDLEYIVIDGGSTDGTVDILRKYDTNITHWVSEPDKGQSEALNKGFMLATGDVVGWLNSDDTYQQGTLDQVASIFRDPEVDIAMSGYFGFMDSAGLIYDYKKNEYTDHKTLIRYWNTNGMTINQPCVFFRRNLIESYSPVVDTSLHYAMDYDLWLRLTREHRIRVVPGHWANYRFHQSNKSGQGFERFYYEWNQVSRRYWGSKYSYEWWLHCLNYNLRKISWAIQKRLFLK